MSGEQNTSILNRIIGFLMLGRQAAADAEPQPVLLTEDRELAIAARLIGGSTRVIEPTEPQVLTGVSTNYYTASDLTEVTIEVVNSLNFDGATVLVTYSLNGVLVEKVALPSTTPVPIGVGVRVGPYYLLAGGTVQASCSPPLSVTIHIIPQRVEG